MMNISADNTDPAQESDERYVLDKDIADKLDDPAVMQALINSPNTELRIQVEKDFEFSFALATCDYLPEDAVDRLFDAFQSENEKPPVPTESPRAALDWLILNGFTTEQTAQEATEHLLEQLHTRTLYRGMLPCLRIIQNLDPRFADALAQYDQYIREMKKQRNTTVELPVIVVAFIQLGYLQIDTSGKISDEFATGKTSDMPTTSPRAALDWLALNGFTDEQSIAANTEQLLEQLRTHTLNPSLRLWLPSIKTLDPRLDHAIARYNLKKWLVRAFWLGIVVAIVVGGSQLLG